MVTINKKFNFNRVKEDYYRPDLDFFYFDDDAVYYTESHYLIRIYYDDFFKSDCDIDTSMLAGKKLTIQAIKILQKNKHLNILAMESVRVLPNCYKFALNEIFPHQTSLSIQLE